MRVRILDQDITGLKVGTELDLVARRPRFDRRLVEWTARCADDGREYTILDDWIDGAACEQIGDVCPTDGGGL